VIVLTARVSGPDLEIEVEDDGPGFPADFLAHASSGSGAPIPAADATREVRAWDSPSSRPSPWRTGGVAAARNKPDGGAVVGLRLPHAARF
jgi:hypothetical protein